MPTGAEYIKAMKELFLTIEKRMKIMDEALKAGDYAGAGKCFADKVKIILPSGETLTGRDAAIENLKKTLTKEVAASTVLRMEEVNGEGEWAYARGTYKSKDDSGKFVTVWKKIDGEFMIWNDIFNTSKAPAS